MIHQIIGPMIFKPSPFTRDLALTPVLPGGEISRDLVADVSIAAVFDSKASNKATAVPGGGRHRYQFWLMVMDRC